jgi:hypothetical protein
VALLDVGAVRRAVAEACSLIDGLWSYGYVPDAINLGPAGAIVVTDAEVDELVTYHQVGGETAAVLLLDVIVVVPSINAELATALLDDYRGIGTPRSILSALESLPNLSGLVDAVTVKSAGPVRAYQTQSQADQPGTRFWSVTFAVEVMTP